MEPITHQRVRALLQAAANQPLPVAEQAVVNAHLAECHECQAYATGLDELQDGLRRVMRHQWYKQPAPLPLQTIKDRSRRVQRRNKINGTIGKFAVVPLLAFAFVLAVRMVSPQQIAANTAVLTMQTPQLALRTPTPTLQNGSTAPTSATCDRTVYVVQKNDTLDGIAARYGVPREAIMSYNGLASDTLAPNTTLVIPLCLSTPTGTSTAPSLTTTTQPLGASVAPSPES
jgi:LysM repeat protein